MTKQNNYILALFAFLLAIQCLSAQVPCGSNVSLSFTQNNVACFGGNNGSATAIVTGGSGSYQYSWIPSGANTQTASNLSAGSYTAYVLDNGGGSIDTVNNQNFDCSAAACTMNTPTGTNDTDPNQWMVSDDEGGVLPPNCGMANNGNQTLYVVATGLFAGSGATYNAGGLCAALGICVTSNYRAESPNISTIGYSSLNLSFDYIGVGDGLNDNASLVYSTNGGSTWTTLAASLKSNVCANGQGQWTAASYALPAACNNLSNLRIGFVWTNNDDGVGSDPSFACDNIRIIGSSASTGVCYVTGSVNITQPTALSATTTSTATACQGQNNGTATAFPTGGTSPYFYSWNNGQTTATASGLAAGAYTCIITDNNGCQFTTNATVASGAALSLSSAATPTSCNGGNDGSATVTVTSGGTGNITYTWSNGQTTQTAGNLSAGTYACVVSTSTGCTQSISVTISQPLPIAVSPTIVNPNCDGQTTGSIDLTIVGGTAPYLYSWSNNATSNPAINLGAGTYNCVITDSKNCTQFYVGTITTPPALSLTMSSTNANPVGTATATASGGTPSYTYSWNTNPPQTTATATNLSPGQYVCTVTDSKGCSKQAPIVVESSIAIEPQTIGINHFAIYPNPSESELNWSIETSENQDISLFVYEINGKEIFSAQTKNTLVWQDKHNFSNLSSGIYFIKISTSKGEIYQKWQVK